MTKRTWFSVAGLVTAVVLLSVGAIRSHKVYETGTAEAFGIQTFVRLSDKQLIVDSTFGGVERKGDQLFSTYDRAAGGGKRACPT